MKILSFIIPAYNCRQFLDKCVTSLLDPEVLDRLDIIIVNDGSTDATAEAARKYCERYPGSVRLIDQPNRGHGGALNAGCAAAVGKYLKAVDADDWVETENLKQYLHMLERCGSDVVLTHHRTINIATGDTKNWRTFPPVFGKAYTLGEIMGDWKRFDRGMTFHGITYNTEFYQKNGIRLTEQVFYEDHEFAAFPCCAAKSVMPVDLFLYDYRIGDANQSVSDENRLRRIGHTETVLDRFISEYQRLDLPEGSGGRVYAARKAQGLLLSYLTTALLMEPDRKRGREMGARIMKKFRAEMPEAWALARRQYQFLLIMNRAGARKGLLENILESGVYNRLRGNHDFT